MLLRRGNKAAVFQQCQAISAGMRLKLNLVVLNEKRAVHRRLLGRRRLWRLVKWLLRFRWTRFFFGTVDLSLAWAKCPRTFLDYRFALRGNDFLRAPIEFGVFNETISVGESSSTLGAAVGLFTLKCKRQNLYVKSETNVG